MINKGNFYLIISLVFYLVIFIFSIIPEGTGRIKPFGFLLHFIAYFVLSFSILIYFKFKEENLFWAPVIAGSYGFIIELIQYFIPYRHFEILDILVNFSGAIAIFIFYIILVKYFN